MSLLPRILPEWTTVSNGDLRSHLAVAGSLPELRRWAPDRLIDEIERSGLRGRGGAAFPVARKMRAVAARRGPRFVVGNGTEGEPASGKDRLLLTELPHLVLDGAAVAARAVGADTAIIAFAAERRGDRARVWRAVDERRRSRPGDEPDTSYAPSRTASSRVTSPLWSTLFPVRSQSPRSARDHSNAASVGDRRSSRTSRRSHT